MKKHMISRSIAGFYIFVFFLIVGSVFFWVWLLSVCVELPLDFSYFKWEFIYELGPIAFSIIGLLGLIHDLLFKYMLGKFSVNSGGITMYVGFKQFYHPWDSFIDFGCISVQVGSRSKTGWIYFATRHLTTIEKQLFLRKTWKDLENIAFFQYTADTLDEVLPLMPHHIAHKIREGIEFSKTGIN